MKEEVLRMDRITYREQGATELNHFCLDIDAGEIVGLIPINDTGLAALIRLLRQNLPPIHVPVPQTHPILHARHE